VVKSHETEGRMQTKKVLVKNMDSWGVNGKMK